MGLSAAQQRLVAAVQDGLPLVPRPYAEIGARLGLSEAEVIAQLRALLAAGVIKRLGVVVRHHELGYCANAMVVWDVPDERVAEVGRRAAAVACVTLCYLRPRRPPDWPYNLFTMVHGRDRATVAGRIAQVIERCGLAAVPHEVLFSRRRFKQRGAHYLAPPVSHEGLV